MNHLWCIRPVIVHDRKRSCIRTSVRRLGVDVDGVSKIKERRAQWEIVIIVREICIRDLCEKVRFRCAGSKRKSRRRNIRWRRRRWWTFNLFNNVRRDIRQGTTIKGAPIREASNVVEGGRSSSGNWLEYAQLWPVIRIGELPLLYC